MVKNSPCNAGNSGLIPGWGTRIPHAAEQLSLSARTKTQCNQINIKNKQIAKGEKVMAEPKIKSYLGISTNCNVGPYLDANSTCKNDYDNYKIIRNFNEFDNI